MNQSIVGLIFLALSPSLSAQSFELSGSLIDDKKEVVAFATVALFKAVDSSFQEGTITNETGQFLLANLDSGQYYLKVSHLLYMPTITSLEIPTGQPLVPIELQPSTQELDELVVTADREAFQNAIGKITINPDLMLAGKGGSAADVLKSIPIVNVSPEGSVTIRGGGDIQILINGKPSGMVAVQGSQFLSQIDASVIERIEVITSPSAKYGSDGGSGIINVILKKDRTEGLKGNVLLSAANRDRYTVSPSISFRKRNLNVFLRYSLLQNTRRTKGFGDQVRNDTIAISHTGSGRFKDLRHNLEFGTDYFLGARRYLTLAGLFRYRDKSSNGLRQSEVFYNNVQQEDRTTRSAQPETNNGYGITLSYFSENEAETKKTEILLDVVHSVEDETIDRVDDLFEFPTDERLFTGGFSRNVDVNDGIFLDVALIRPISNGQFDLGARYFYRNIDQDFDLTLVDPLTGMARSNTSTDVFSYNDHVSAIYGELSQELGKFKLSGGLRIEYSVNQYWTQSSDEQFNNTFFNLFPNVSAGYQISPSATIAFNYGRRINRPAPNRLNPFPDISSPFRTTIGNPNLNPEFINTYNLGYSVNFTQSSLVANVFFKSYKDYIQRISVIDDTGFNIVSPVNLETFLNYGFDISYSQSLRENWEINVGMLSFQNHFLSAGDDIDNSGFSSQFKLSSTIDLTRKISWQAQGYWNLAEANSQGERLPQYYLDTGLNFEWKEDKVDVTLSVSDIFNTLKEVNRTQITTFISRSERKVDTRIFRLSFNYKI